jgi:hypothetical protein
MIEAGSAGVEVNARGKSPGIGAEFISLLVQDTRAVARCELEAHGEEVGYTNAYGWTGEHFLGASNMTG